jgi:hypothetical protein
MAWKTFQRGDMSASFFYMAVSVPATYPREDGEPRRGGKVATGGAATTLGRGLRDATAESTSNRVRRMFSLAFPLHFPARPKSRGSYIRLARRPSRTPIGLGRSAPRFGGSGPCIVKVEQQFRSAFLDKWTYFHMSFCLQNYFCCYCLGGGDCGNYCGWLQF